MIVPWRRLALTAAIFLAVGVGSATAQTVIVRNAPPGSPVEVVLNGTAVGAAKADARGDTTVRVDPTLVPGFKEFTVRIQVDACTTAQRVHIVERARQPPAPEADCTRRDVAGLFVFRPVTSMVVELTDPTPSVWLRQGAIPKAWLTGDPTASRVARSWARSHRGLALFGGAGLSSFGDVVSTACGTAPECAGDGSPLVYSVGATYWIVPYVGIEASYLFPADVKVEGGGDGYRFTSTFDSELITVAGKIGVPIGRVRAYGQVGANYHRALFSTTQTVDPTTITVDEVTETIPGDTQTIQLKTGGWGWVFGGGAEVWLHSNVAVYGEFGRAALKGPGREGAEGSIDERVTYLVAGLRVRIGR